MHIKDTDDSSDEDTRTKKIEISAQKRVKYSHLKTSNIDTVKLVNGEFNVKLTYISYLLLFIGLINISLENQISESCR